MRDKAQMLDMTDLDPLLGTARIARSVAARTRVEPTFRLTGADAVDTSELIGLNGPWHGTGGGGKDLSWAPWR